MLDTNELIDFFCQWKIINPENLFSDDVIVVPAFNNLEKWIADFPSMKKIKRDPSFFNPWDIIGIKRKEVASCSVLAWLLDPEGNHGMGNTILNLLLKRLNKKQYRFPYDYGHYCYISTERNIGSENKNRVDIVIDTESYYLIIEAKIDAGEQESQLSRYCKEANSRVDNKPWGLVFLTPNGQAGNTTGEWKDNIYPISWSELAADIDRTLLWRPDFSRGHNITSECAVIHSIRCFVENMHDF